LIYRLLHFLLQKSLNRHFDEIKSFNHAAIPAQGPLIVAATHPNSFLDAIIIAASVKRPMHFLARSDVFKSPLVAALLKKMNLIPIYRQRDGRHKLIENHQSFEACYDILASGGAILIFAEGISVGDKKIRPLKKGLAKILFRFMAKHPEAAQPQLMACGINYEKINSFGSRVLLGYSDLIDYSDLVEDAPINQGKAIQALNLRLEEMLREHSILVEPEDERFHQALVELDPCYEQNSLIRKSLIAKKIENLKQRKSDKYRELKKEVAQMEELLIPYHLDFESLKHKVAVSSKDFLLFFLSLPLSILGYLGNAIPFGMAYLIAKSTTKKAPEFYLSVRFAAGTLLWLAWAAVISIYLSTAFSAWFVLSPLVLLYTYKVFRQNHKRWKKIRTLLWIKKMKANQSDSSYVQEEIRKIIKLRAALGLSAEA